MSNIQFYPVEEMTILCRFCNKITTAELDRSIAGNGRTPDKDGTFEYSCAKCSKSFCFAGKDLLSKEEAELSVEPRMYTPKDGFKLGEAISHKSLNDKGVVVGKESGTPNCILVQFHKQGLKKLVENI